MNSIGLYIVKNRAQIQDKVRFTTDFVYCMTASDFFEQISLLAFVEDARFLSDSAALPLVAADILANEDGQHFLLAPYYSQLFRAVIHGGSSPQEILEILAAFPDEKYCQTIFSCLNQMALRMRLLGKIDKASALRVALDRMKGKDRLPAFLQKFSHVTLEGLVDLTALEQGVIEELKNLGLPVTQVDYALDAKPLHEALTYFAEGVLNEKPVMPELSDHVEVYLANDIVQEARWLASKIASLRLSSKKIPRIAVALRSLDGNDLFFKDALSLHGISVQDQRSRKLSESPSGRLLLDLLYATVKQFPKDDVIHALSCAAYKKEDKQTILLKDMARYLKKAGIRNNVEDAKIGEGAYVHRLQRLKNAARSGEQRDRIQNVIDVISKLLQIQELLPKRATLKIYVKALLDILESRVVDSAEGFNKLKEKLMHMEEIFAFSNAEISLLSWTKWFEKILSQENWIRPGNEDAYAVEILALPDLVGRRFDYVAIVDMVHGRLPKNTDHNPLLKDAERAKLNCLIGRPIFQVSESVSAQDPVSLQAIEAKFFLGALKAAHRGLILTSSRQDQSKREQAQSEYFDAAVSMLGEDHFSSIKVPIVFNQLESCFSQAKYWVKTREPSQLSGADIAYLKIVQQMHKQRAQFFQKAKEISVLDVTDIFSFKTDPHIFRPLFSDHLGLSEDRPLSYTRIEKLAQCRFRGFVEGMLKVDLNAAAGNDMDARALGRLAHEVLEIFYKNRGAIEHRNVNEKDRTFLTSILYQRAKRYIEAEATGNQIVLQAYVAWLNTALLRLVSNLTKSPPVADVYPKGFELAVGLNRGEKDFLLKAIPIQIGQETLYFGGVLDRVDEGENARVVVDYKISNTTNIKRKVEEKQILKTHFQLPLYLRLLEHHLPTLPSVELLGYLISIADGTISPILGRDCVKEIRRRILNDDAVDGLAASLQEILHPVLVGAVPADVSERCDDCRLKRVCRVPSERVMML